MKIGRREITQTAKKHTFFMENQRNLHKNVQKLEKHTQNTIKHKKLTKNHKKHKKLTKKHKKTTRRQTNDHKQQKQKEFFGNNNKQIRHLMNNHINTLTLLNKATNNQHIYRKQQEFF
jgi:hypothetical protein